MANIKIDVPLHFSAFIEWSPKLGRYVGTLPALRLRVDGASISDTRKILRDVAHRHIALLRRAYERERRRRRKENDFRGRYSLAGFINLSWQDVKWKEKNAWTLDV